MVTVQELPIQKRAERFESQTRDSLKRLGFRDINGGHDFRIGGIQIDACAGHEDTLIVIECVIAARKGRKPVRQKLQTFRGNMPILSRALHKDDTYRKYSNFKYVLATKNIEIGPEDRQFAEEKPQINTWDEQFLDYYASLSSIIGATARYNLLGEIGVKPRVQNVIQIPAFQTRLQNHTLYLFFIEPQRLFQASYVARREVGQEKYYQRLLNKKRIGQIRRFIDKGGMFPNDIIVSFSTEPKFIPFNEVSVQWKEWPDWLRFGILTFPSGYRTCWIIDGQHRLYSFPEHLQRDKIAVVAFEKLRPEKQAQFFIEINSEQKPVEPDLIWDLEGEMRPNTEKGVISNVVKSLNTIAPLTDRIYVPLRGRRRKGQLKFSALCLSLQKTRLIAQITETMEGAQKNPLYSTDFQRMVSNVSKALAAFFVQVDKHLSEDEKGEFAFTNGGVTVMIALFERILSRANRTPSETDLSKYVQALHKVLSAQYPGKTDRKDLRLRITSEGGRSELVRSLVLAIREVTGDKQFGGSLQSEDFGTRVTQFERHFATFTLSVLGARTVEDMQKYAPPDICGKVQKRQKADIAKGRYDQDLSEHLTLGECSNIVWYTNNLALFRPFLLESPSGFGTQVELDAALRAVTDFRNDLLHGKVVSDKYRQKELLNLYLDKLEKCIEELESS